MLKHYDQKKLVILDVIGALVAIVALLFVTFIIIHVNGVMLVIGFSCFIFAAFQLLAFSKNIAEYIRVAKINKKAYGKIVLTEKSKLGIL